MRIPKGENGNSKFEVGTHDMGGLTRTISDSSGPTPADLAVFLHQFLLDLGSEGGKLGHGRPLVIIERELLNGLRLGPKLLGGDEGLGRIP